MPQPRKKLPANGLAIIRDLASTGARETQIAAGLGMAFETWHRIREEDPKAKAAWTEARAIERDSLVGVLYGKAMKGDTVSAIFLLKSRHGYRDQGDPVAEKGGTAVVINLPSAMSEEQWGKLVEVSPVTIPDASESAAEVHHA